MTDITQAYLLERAALRERQINTVHRISAALFSVGNLDSLLRETLRVSLETVDADAGSVLLYDAERGMLVFRYVIGKTELIGQEIDPRVDLPGNAATAFRDGRSLITVTPSADSYNPQFDSVTGYQTTSILTVPLKNLGGQPIGVMQALNKREGVFDKDDLELLEIVASLAATSIVNARLAEEAQLAAVGRAVGDLGHDIKNALTPIETMVDTTIDLFLVPMFQNLDRLMSEWRAEHPDMCEELQAAVQNLRDWYPETRASVKDGCADIREMVGEIADYIKGTQSTNKVVSDLGAILRERLCRLEVMARTRQVTLHLEGLDGVPPFPFDRRLLCRAVYNLVSNALAAIDDAVKHKTLALRQFHIYISASACETGEFPEGCYCLIRVQDDGPGMPETVKRSLFTPQTISTTPGGTGIGTRFVKSVADAHGGLVGVESFPGKGATFWLKLPMR